MKWSRAAFVVLLAQLAPSVALASGGGFVLKEHGFYLVDFVVLVAALVYFGRKPLRRLLRTRRDTLEQEIDEARTLQDKAREMLREYEQRIAGLDAEVEAIRERAQAEAEALKQRIVAEGRAQAEKLVADSEARLRQEAQALRTQLLDELVTQATREAEALVEKGLTADRQRRFVQEYVAQIDALAAAQSGGSGVAGA